MAKFFSKSANLMVVLSPGLQAQPLTGTPAKPTVSVRFKDGMADVANEDVVKMMLEHPGFNSDFIAEESPVDPYKFGRQSTEPAHILVDMEHGTPGEKKIVGEAPKFSPEMQKLINAAAIEMAKSMLPTMVEATLKDIMNDRNTKTVVKKPVKSGKKVKKSASNGIKNIKTTIDAAQIPPSIEAETL